MRRLLVLVAMAGAVASACASPSSSSKTDSSSTIGISGNGAAMEVQQAPKNGDTVSVGQPPRSSNAPGQRTGPPAVGQSPAANFLNPDAPAVGRKCAGTPESAPTCNSK